MLVKLAEDYQTTLVRGDSDIADQKINIKGFTESLPASGSKTLWGIDSDHYNPSAASQMKIKSDSANDSSGGTGARTATITGIGYSGTTNNGEVVTETITLNGTNVVTTSNSYFCIYNFIIATVGITKKNQGNIKAYVSNDATEIVNYIKQYENNSSMSIYRVPITKNLLVRNIQVSGTCNGANLHLRIINPSDIEYSEFVFRIGTFGGHIDFTIDKIFASTTIIWIKIVPDTNIPSSTTNCGISALVNGILY